MSDHRKRWITGLAAVPPLCWLVWKGGLPFALLVAVVSSLSLLEYFRLVFSGEDKPLCGVVPIGASLAGPLIVLAAHWGGPGALSLALAGGLLFTAIPSLACFGRHAKTMTQLPQMAQALLYVPLLLSFAVLIRNGEHGAQWILLILVIVFAGDIGALYTGTCIGCRKLCPSISPKKTIEGALGGLAANVVVALLGKPLLAPEISWGGIMLMALSLGVAGQVGDLYESQFKRAAGIKDSGALLPGHGGILDRIDALLFALPVAHGFITVFFPG